MEMHLNKLGVITVALESERSFGEKLKRMLKDAEKTLGEGTVSIISSMISDTVVGQVAPGLYSVMLNYRQKRFENNVLRLLKELNGRIDFLERVLKGINSEVIGKIRNDIFPLVVDYAAEEQEIEKIEYITNGFESIVEKSIVNQDIILINYDVLKQLRMVDLMILKRIRGAFIKTTIGVENDELKEYREFESLLEENIEYKQYAINKLEMLGLILKEDYVYKSEEYTLDGLALSNFGKQFIDFCKLKRES